MKKIILVCCILLITGCKNNLVCTLTTTEGVYTSEQKITFDFKDDQVSNVELNYAMIFEDEKTANDYFTAFEALKEQYEIKQDKNKIEIISEKNYDQYNQNKDELKEELEAKGYSCK